MHAIPMPELALDESIGNFLEVPLGYTAEMAIAEAARAPGKYLQQRQPGIGWRRRIGVI
jgi:hypothetical protein